MLGAASGCVAGLVAITPASGFVNPMCSIIIGLVAGIICYFAVSIMKAKLGYDDALDTFGVHGIGGTWGALATGLFATTAINANGHNGLFFGNPGQLWTQFIGVCCQLGLFRSPDLHHPESGWPDYPAPGKRGGGDCRPRPADAR